MPRTFRRGYSALPSIYSQRGSRTLALPLRYPYPLPTPNSNPAVLQEGVIGIPPPKALGLCAGMTNAPYATTTEVYPDSPQANGAQCNAAQVNP